MFAEMPLDNRAASISRPRPPSLAFQADPNAAAKRRPKVSLRLTVL
jgi:hypothetical protein